MIVVDPRGHEFLRTIADEVRPLPIGDAWIYLPGEQEPAKTYEVKWIRDFWSRVTRGEINFQLGVSALLMMGEDPPEEEFDRRRWFSVVNGVNRKVPVYRFIEPYREQVVTRTAEIVGAAGGYIFNALSATTRATVVFVFHFIVMLYTMFFFVFGPSSSPGCRSSSAGPTPASAPPDTRRCTAPPGAAIRTRHSSPS